MASGGETLVIRLTVTDNDRYNPKSDEDTVAVNVLNINDPPSCHLAFPSSEVLWPPDHGMEAVSIEGVMDADDMYNEITLDITGVTQDEAVNGTGDGDSAPDAVILHDMPADHVMPRAERSGNGNGRVYEISFLASDGKESCRGSVTVSVPPNRKGDALNDGQIFQSK